MDFLKKHKRAYIITAVIICCVAIATSFIYRTQPTLFESLVGYVITPIQKHITRGMNFAGSKIESITNISEIEVENKRLKEEVESLKAELSRLSLVESENGKLSELLGISQKYSNYQKIGAEIIAKDPGNWYKTFTIDKGANHGLKKNMVVLAGGGLVGRVFESGHSYSKIVSLIDDTFSVSAKSAQSEDIGFVRGDSNLMTQGLCRMDFIDATAKILVNDEIVTSHLGGIYPPGITIGHVKEIINDPNGLTKYAIIQPTVDFRHLETILVVTELFENLAIEEDE